MNIHAFCVHDYFYFFVGNAAFAVHPNAQNAHAIAFINVFLKGNEILRKIVLELIYNSVLLQKFSYLIFFL